MATRTCGWQIQSDDVLYMIYRKEGARARASAPRRRLAPPAPLSSHPTPLRPPRHPDPTAGSDEWEEINIGDEKKEDAEPAA